MKLLFKITGFILTVFTASAIGYFKSAQLKSRYEELTAVHKNISHLKESIRLHGGESDRLIKQSFGKSSINKTVLHKEDIGLLNEFFDNFGFCDTKAECERCELYIELFKSKIEEAEKKYRESGKLYKSLGIMCGIFICIFLL